MLDAKALAETTGLLVKGYVERALSPILQRLAAIEARKPEKGEPGEKGMDGTHGKDGLGFDDLEVIHDGERGFTFRMTRGDQVKEFPFSIPVVLDRGVFKGAEHVQGDAVTWAGSLWIAQKATSAKPGEGDDWRLAVKRGRDGKDAR